jgi:hypothetical protein
MDQRERFIDDHFRGLYTMTELCAQARQLASASTESPVSTLLLNLFKVREAGGPAPTVGSPAEKEINGFAHPESVATAFCMR